MIELQQVNKTYSYKKQMQSTLWWMFPFGSMKEN